MKEKHESYGFVQLGRINSGGGHTLFGSKIKHSNWIYLKITGANFDTERDKPYEDYSNRIIEVKFSPIQFAELITSISMGDGVPCTIERIGDRVIENPPEIETVDKIVTKKFNEEMDSFQNKLNDCESKINTILEKKTFSKDDKEDIKRLIQYIRTETKMNMPFYEEQMQKTIDKTVLEAKLQFEAHKIATVEKLGLQALATKIENNENLLLNKGENFNIDEN